MSFLKILMQSETQSRLGFELRSAIPFPLPLSRARARVCDKLKLDTYQNKLVTNILEYHFIYVCVCVCVCVF